MTRRFWYCAAAVLAAAWLASAGDALAQADEPARLVTHPPASYPLKARRLGLEGRVVIAIRLRPDGAIESARVERSSGHPLLDAEALRVANAATYEPARRDGNPVAASVWLPVQFALPDVDPPPAKPASPPVPLLP